MQPALPHQAIVVFDIDGVIRDVGGSYRRALADTVEHFTHQAYRPTPTDIDTLKAEGLWNNDWQASQELIYRYFEAHGQSRTEINLDYEALVTFFQNRYRGPDPQNWTGYICQEPLLVNALYLQSLTQANITWGFFSGATRASATYVLETRLGLQSPTLIAMEDAPGKPDPTGLIATVNQLEQQQTIGEQTPGDVNETTPVLYIGDTVADMQTVLNVRDLVPNRNWIGVGVLPPHAQQTQVYSSSYTEKLQQAGASIVLKNVEELTAEKIRGLV
ncbi:MAG: TIGR01548 family HAD-type hydrolase [Cyanothece sp. SIO1E1]|nr:TIGR01548 family HAD-type hydrolase [Cyanothece sp. SIO1E1]